MIKTAFVFLVLCCSVVIELLFGNYGLPFCVTLTAICYFAIQQSAFRAAIMALICGFALDLIYGRTFMISAPVMITAAYFALWWSDRFGPELLYYCIPGALSGAFYALALSLANGGVVNIFRLAEILSLTVCSAVAGALLLPLMISTIDAIAKFLDFEGYAESIRERVHRRE